MTVHTGSRVISKIGMRPEHVHKQCPSPHNNTANDDSRYLPFKRRKESIYYWKLHHMKKYFSQK